MFGVLSMILLLVSVLYEIEILVGNVICVMEVYVGYLKVWV